jgi:hypothetical protein
MACEARPKKFQESLQPSGGWRYSPDVAGRQRLPGGDRETPRTEETAMWTKVTALAVLGLMGLALTGRASVKAEPVPVTLKGKLVKVKEMGVRPLLKPGEPATERIVPLWFIAWKLQTSSGTYTLHLGSRTLTRLAEKLQGKYVSVTGRRDGQTIDVREMAEEPTEYTGVLHRWLPDIKVPPPHKPVPMWTLHRGLCIPPLHLHFENKSAGREAHKLIGSRVRVQGYPNDNGFVVTAIEAVK